jgi:hypothetical protein
MGRSCTRRHGSEVTVFSVSVIGDSMDRSPRRRRIPRTSSALWKFVLMYFTIEKDRPLLVSKENTATFVHEGTPCIKFTAVG